MFSFSYKEHSEEMALVLAREWTRKANFFYELFLASGEDEAFDYDTAEQFVLSQDFFDAYDQVVADSTTATRFLDLSGSLHEATEVIKKAKTSIVYESYHNNHTDHGNHNL